MPDLAGTQGFVVRCIRMNDNTEARGERSPVNEVVVRNIEALLDRQRRRDQSQPMRERAAVAITKFAGSLTFVYLHLAGVLAWILINAGLTPLPKFDPSFVLLATIASVEAIFLTAFVLITQNRMQIEADRRAELDLQISLLTEHELTRLIALVSRIAERNGVPTTGDREIEELQRDVAPEQILDTLEEKYGRDES
jgi:uncharacterized membrane protein